MQRQKEDAEKIHKSMKNNISLIWKIPLQLY